MSQRLNILRVMLLLAAALVAVAWIALLPLRAAPNPAALLPAALLLGAALAGAWWSHRAGAPVSAAARRGWLLLAGGALMAVLASITEVPAVAAAIIAGTLQAAGVLCLLSGMSGGGAVREEPEEGLQFTQFAVDHLTDPIFWVDENARFVYANEAAQRTLGYTLRELTELHVWDIAPLRTSEEWPQRWQWMRDAGSMTYESRLRHRQGAILPIEISVTHQVFKGREYVCAVARDISARREAEQRARFQAQLLDSVRESVIATSLDGRIIYWGRGAEALYDYAAEEVMGRSVTLIVPPQELEEEERRIEQVRRAGSWRGQYLQRRRDGSPFWADTLISLVLDEQGQPSGLVGIDRDITERLESERQLKASEQQLRRAQQIARVGSWEWHVPSGHMTWSEGMYTIYGVAPGSFGGTIDAAFAFVHEDDRPAAERRGAALRAGERTGPLEFRIRRADGSERIIWCDAQPADDHEPPEVILGTVQDITERKQAEEELRQRSRTEQRLFRELDHRVRNSFSSLEALVDMAVRSSTSLESFARTTRERVHAMARMHEMLSSSRWTPVSLRAMIELFAPPECRGVVHADGEELLIPAAQGTALGMVLHELMINSLKHGALKAPQGRVLIRWTCEQEREREQRCQITWEERGGAPIADPAHNGVGTKLISGLIRADLRGELKLSFPPEGARHSITLRLDRSEEGDGPRPGGQHMDKSAPVVVGD